MLVCPDLLITIGAAVQDSCVVLKDSRSDHLVSHNVPTEASTCVQLKICSVGMRDRARQETFARWEFSQSHWGQLWHSSYAQLGRSVAFEGNLFPLSATSVTIVARLESSRCPECCGRKGLACEEIPLRLLVTVLNCPHPALHLHFGRIRPKAHVIASA